MICASADLCNSDKTDGFLKTYPQYYAKRLWRNFYQAGVSELTMACICIGMVLHGGVQAAMEPSSCSPII